MRSDFSLTLPFTEYESLSSMLELHVFGAIPVCKKDEIID